MADREVVLHFRVSEQGLEVLDRAGAKVRDVKRETDELGKSSTSASASIGAVKRETGEMGDVMGRARTHVVALGAALGAAAVAGTVALVRSSINAASEVEALKVRLVGLTGSTHAASAAYQRMANLAATTPFDLKGVVEAGATIRAFGDSSEETLKAVTDLAAFMGTSAVEAAAAYGRAFAGGAGAAEILRERGVLEIVKLQSGINDLTKLTLPQFRKALLDAMTDPGGRIAGSTDRLADSWIGMTSNVGDAMFQLRASLGSIITENDAVRGSLRGTSDAINDMTEDVNEWADANRDVIATNLAGWLDLVAGAVRGLQSIGEVPVFKQLRELNLGLIERALGALASLPATIDTRKQQVLDLVVDSDINNPDVEPGITARANAGDRRAQALIARRRRLDARRPELDAMRAQSRIDREMVSSALNETGPSSVLPFGDFLSGTGTQGFGGGGFSDARPYDQKGYNYYQEDVGPFQPGDPRAPKDRSAATTTSRAARTTAREQAESEKRLLEALADQEAHRLALLDLQITRRDTAVSLAEEDLRLAQQIGATGPQQIALAQRLDSLEAGRLTATRERIEAEIDGLMQFGPVVSAEVVKLQGEVESVNAELARGPQHARELTAELERAGRTSNNLGASFAAAINSLQSSGEDVNVANLFRNVLQIDAADLLGDAVGGLAKKLDIDGDSLTEIIGNGVTKAFGGIGSLFGGGAAVSSISGGVAAATGGAFGDFASGLAGSGIQSSVATAAGAEAAAAGAGGSAGGMSAAYYAAIVLAAIGGIEGAVEGAKAEKRRVGANDDDVTQAAAAGWFEGAFGAVGLEGIGNIAGKLARKLPAESLQALAWVLGPVEGLLFGLGGNAPTRGTQVKRVLNDLYSDARLPRQRVSNRGGRAGVQTQGIESAPDQDAFDELAARGFGRGGLIAQGNLANEINEAAAQRPEVANLRTNEALALGAVIGETPRDAANITNAMTNNFLLLGVSVGEARRQMLKLADEAGVNLVGGLEELNLTFFKTKKTGEDMLRLQSAAEGLVKLFSDLPAAIDVQAIVARNTSQTAGVDINAVEWNIRGAVGALDLREQIADSRLAGLDQRMQGTEIRRRISDLDRQLGAGTNASGDPLTEAQRERLLQQRAQLGFQYVQYADQRFDGTARRRAQEFGYSIVDDTARQLERLGTTTATASESQVAATDKSTEKMGEVVTGLNGLVKAIETGIQGKVKLDVTGLDSEDQAVVASMIRRILKDILTEPEFRASQRENVG